MTVALGSWAVLRLLDGTEPAATRVATLLDNQRPVMSWVNLGEVFYAIRREYGEDEATDTIRDLRSKLDLDLPTEALVLSAARIKSDYRCAYADGFAAATSMSHDADLWTGDPELLVENAPWRWTDLR